ncbi:hypothetical protein CONLIGDRAFT_685780 [Coniochaeta ligniaria NRRL 30616]|uniref:Uncharacterized protein n=1 Tax=Coniochaeta ligniaria NRRL 30616 TaxID=1408157 RepID=A0A1J7J4T4_9PEZI|nr:hypothetical protein CONLIGDRAFT_685780 [Coniochaeta ligniaria NRRL 30616]
MKATSQTHKRPVPVHATRNKTSPTTPTPPRPVGHVTRRSNPALVTPSSSTSTSPNASSKLSASGPPSPPREGVAATRIFVSPNTNMRSEIRRLLVFRWRFRHFRHFATSADERKIRDLLTYRRLDQHGMRRHYHPRRTLDSTTLFITEGLAVGDFAVDISSSIAPGVVILFASRAGFRQPNPPVLQQHQPWQCFRNPQEGPSTKLPIRGKTAVTDEDPARSTHPESASNSQVTRVITKCIDCQKGFNTKVKLFNHFTNNQIAGIIVRGRQLQLEGPIRPGNGRSEGDFPRSSSLDTRRRVNGSSNPMDSILATYLNTITALPVGNNVDLHRLYRPGGTLYDATLTASDKGVPDLFTTEATVALVELSKLLDDALATGDTSPKPKGSPVERSDSKCLPRRILWPVPRVRRGPACDPHVHSAGRDGRVNTAQTSVVRVYYSDGATEWQLDGCGGDINYKDGGFVSNGRYDKAATAKRYEQLERGQDIAPKGAFAGGGASPGASAGSASYAISRVLLSRTRVQRKV